MVHGQADGFFVHTIFLGVVAITTVQKVVIELLPVIQEEIQEVIQEVTREVILEMIKEVTMKTSNIHHETCHLNVNHKTLKTQEVNNRN